MPFAVMEGGALKIDTVYEHETLAKMHWLSFSSGDYDSSDFDMLPGRLDPNVEFDKYPEAIVVPVRVQIDLQ